MNGMWRGGKGRLRQVTRWRVLGGVLTAAVAIGAAFSAVYAVEDRPDVDTALVVAVDVSNSVDEQRYRLQMEGIAQALEDPEVVRAITGGGKGSILFSLLTWSDRPNVTVPWTRIGSLVEARALALRVRTLPREAGEFTCMSRMMRYVSDKIVPQIPAVATKVVLDVSGDGRDNCNADEPIDAVRDELVKYGVTVNGLPILEGGQDEEAAQLTIKSYLPEQQDMPELERWFRDNVKGGGGSFVLPANGYSDFGRAIRQKFVLEVSMLATPHR
jgi:Protein of unknown function (DUF1194)